MNFETTIDSDTTSWKAELVDGNANFYILSQDELDSALVHEDLAVVQPFKPEGDGTRTDWINLEEAVTWFKEQG